MSETLAMGGYGAYVWSCFALTLIVIIICVVQGRRRHNAVYKEISTRIRAMESDG